MARGPMTRSAPVPKSIVRPVTPISAVSVVSEPVIAVVEIVIAVAETVVAVAKFVAGSVARTSSPVSVERLPSTAIEGGFMSIHLPRK